MRAREKDVNGITARKKSEEHRKNRKETHKSMNVHKNIREKQTKREATCM